MSVVLSHVYSRANAGDGLLVDLSLERLFRAGVAAEDITLVALDPDSFAHDGNIVAAGTPGRSLSSATAIAAARSGVALTESLLGIAHSELAECIGGARAVFGVGGGYLRTPDVVSSVGTAVNHLPQLVLAGRSDARTMMLPQSIGPLRGPVGRAVVRGLRSLDTVCVRDPWSASELQGRVQVHEIPDLAVLDIADRWSGHQPVASGGKVVVAPRKVEHAPGYMQELETATADLGDGVVWAVQAEGEASKSDGAFMRESGIEPEGRLADVLAVNGVSCVVSARLHGALGALREGIAAIHLAYDRKGPAAFGALGLGEYCLDIRTAKAEQISSLVGAIQRNPDSYWECVDREADGLRASSAFLDELVARTLAGGAAAARGLP